jgi:hypothetical protein
MTTATIKITEGEFSGKRAAPWRLSAEANNVGPEPIWQRIEDWTRYRWGSRTVVYIAEGTGDWRPPLSPTTISTVEVWQDSAWAAVTLDPSPMSGFVLLGETYRFTGTVGDTALPPAGVIAAFGRLAEYFAAVAGDLEPGVISSSDGDYSFEKAQPTWKAKAIQLSGAADLLRKYRDLGAS